MILDVRQESSVLEVLQSGAHQALKHLLDPESLKLLLFDGHIQKMPPDCSHSSHLCEWYCQA
jgi:hypothetical protein